MDKIKDRQLLGCFNRRACCVVRAYIYMECTACQNSVVPHGEPEVVTKWHVGIFGDHVGKNTWLEGIAEGTSRGAAHMDKHTSHHMNNRTNLMPLPLRTRDAKHCSIRPTAREMQML